MLTSHVSVDANHFDNEAFQTQIDQCLLHFYIPPS